MRSIADQLGSPKDLGGKTCKILLKNEFVTPNNQEILLAMNNRHKQKMLQQIVPQKLQSKLNRKKRGKMLQ